MPTSMSLSSSEKRLAVSMVMRECPALGTDIWGSVSSVQLLVSETQNTIEVFLVMHVYMTSSFICPNPSYMLQYWCTIDPVFKGVVQHTQVPPRFVIICLTIIQTNQQGWKMDISLCFNLNKSECETIIFCISFDKRQTKKSLRAVFLEPECVGVAVRCSSPISKMKASLRALFPLYPPWIRNFVSESTALPCQLEHTHTHTHTHTLIVSNKQCYN